jgi:hypothetical protein
MREVMGFRYGCHKDGEGIKCFNRNEVVVGV